MVNGNSRVKFISRNRNRKGSSYKRAVKCLVTRMALLQIPQAADGPMIGSWSRRIFHQAMPDGRDLVVTGAAWSNYSCHVVGLSVCSIFATNSLSRYLNTQFFSFSQTLSVKSTPNVHSCLDTSKYSQYCSQRKHAQYLRR